MKRTLVLFGASMVVITVLIGTFYGVIQQTLRLGADMPQLEIAKTVRAKLESGVSLANAVPTEPVQVDTSLAPFVIVYGKNGKVVAYNGQLGIAPPTLPNGVLDNASSTKTHRLTWQPTDTTRIAAVITQTKDGKYYVLSGRNLVEVERLENRTLLLSLFGWVVCVGILSAAFLLLQTKNLDR